MTQENEAGRIWDAADLIGGEDHDFVVNLYLVTLGRLPDPGGYRRYRDLIEGRPERRLEALREVAASEEAARAGTRILFGEGPAVPPGPLRAMGVTLAIRTEWLQQEVTRLQDAFALMGGARFAVDLIEARDAALHFEINALRRELTERLDGLPGPTGSEAAAAWEAAISAMSRLVADLVGDRVAALEAGQERRLRAMEARILALEARQGA